MQRRSLRLFGGRLALLALGLQLVLSFGHLHPEDIFGPLGHAIGQGHGFTEVASDHRAAPASPFHHGPFHHGMDADEDGCAICAAVHLAGTVLLPDPFRLQAPQGTIVAVAAPRLRFVLTPAPFLLFQTRAPPIA